MGDGDKMWKVTDENFSASMAVKAVRVFVDGKKTEVQPVKLGDGEDNVKVTCDAALPLREYTKIVEHASGIKSAAIQHPHSQLTMDVDEHFRVAAAAEDLEASGIKSDEIQHPHSKRTLNVDEDFNVKDAPEPSSPKKNKF